MTSAARTEAMCMQAAFADKLAAIADTFEAWRIADDGQNRTRGFGKKLPICGPAGYAAPHYTIEIYGAATLPDAIDAAKLRCRHKDHLIIRQTDGKTGRKRLHFYAIKAQSGPQYRWNPETYASERVHMLYEHHLFDWDVVAGGPFA